MKQIKHLTKMIQFVEYLGMKPNKKIIINMLKLLLKAKKKGLIE